VIKHLWGFGKVRFMIDLTTFKRLWNICSAWHELDGTGSTLS